MLNARHVTYEQAFGVWVCVWVCVCGGGGGGGDGRERKRTQRSSTAVRGLPGTEKKREKRRDYNDVCSVERDGRLSFLGT